MGYSPVLHLRVPLMERWTACPRWYGARPLWFRVFGLRLFEQVVEAELCNFGFGSVSIRGFEVANV